jgi:ABC-type glycerol-3-phosphate transport system substrate-binding protein
MRSGWPSGGISRREILQACSVASLGIAGCLSTGDRDRDVGQTDIEVWGWDIAAEALALTATEFESAQEGGVSIREFERPAMKTELTGILESGEGAPAAAMLESIDAPAFADSPGGIRDLSGRIADAGLRDDFTDAAWGSVDIDGSTYALPWDSGPVVMYYRRSIWEEYGLDPVGIETWDEFVAAGDKLPDDIALLNLPRGDLNGQWRTLCRQQGMDPITDDGAVNIANDASRRAAAVLNDLAAADMVTRHPGFTDQWATAYESDSIASLLSASWMVGTMRTELPATAGDWGAFQIPAFDPGGRRASNWGGSNLMIPEQVPDETADRAWEYMTWTLAREEMQVLMFEQFGLFPALKAAYDDPAFAEEVAFFGGQPIGELFADVAEAVPRWRFSTATPAISDAIETELSRMIDGEHSPDEAVQAAAETVASKTGRPIA